MLEKLGSRDVRGLEELYKMADNCTQMEEGRRALGFMAEVSANVPETPPLKNPWKRECPPSLTAEGVGLPTAVEAWCLVHGVYSHDVRYCNPVHSLAATMEKRRASRRTRVSTGGCYACGKTRYRLRECRPSTRTMGARGLVPSPPPSHGRGDEGAHHVRLPHAQCQRLAGKLARRFENLTPWEIGSRGAKTLVRARGEASALGGTSRGAEH